MRKKIMSVFLVGILCMGTIVGCGSAEERSTSDQATGNSMNSGANEEADYSEHITISAWVHTDDNEDGVLAGFNENPVITFLSDKFNVEFEWQLPPTGSESEQMNLMIGSGDYTDVFDTTFSQQSCQELFEDGVIQDLTPYVEKYMPNYMAMIQENDTMRKSAYTDDGRIIYIPNLKNEPELTWGGLMYNRQILEDMTGGNVMFPSGKEEPTTVEDWEYMLEIMKRYFESSGITDYACLILPASGFFDTGDILNGFGTTGTYYIDEKDKVQYGILTEEFYNYLVKMKEWYAKGYIYQDFASRSSDPFYFPNPALTYGGAAGIFFGLSEQLGDALSVPENDLIIDMRAVAAPVDTDNNAVTMPANGLVNTNTAVDVYSGGWVVSSACKEDVLIRWLEICDYLFGEEGSMVKSYGLTKEQAGENAVYAKYNMQEGAYWFDDNGDFVYNPSSDPYSGEAIVKENQLRIARLPGLNIETYRLEKANETKKEADKIWTSDGYSSCVPVGVVLNVEENKKYAPLSTACTDYIVSMTPKFIMNTEELTKESFEAFEQQVRNLGMDTCLELWQTAYDRYLEK